jgi:hypothetical protein
MSGRLWVSSNGGPLILLPVSYLTAWLGIEAPATQPSHHTVDHLSDYERACAVADYTGVILVGNGECLVLGDDPNDTTWLPNARGGIFARWIYAAGFEAAEPALTSIPADLVWESAGVLKVATTPLELFDAAETGTEVLAVRLRIELTPGKYEIARADHKPDADTWFQLIRLQSTTT